MTTITLGDFLPAYVGRMSSNSVLLATFLLAVGALTSTAAEPTKTIELWPDGPPGTNTESVAEHDTTKATDALIAGKPVIRLGNVSKPTLTIYQPPKER